MENKVILEGKIHKDFEANTTATGNTFTKIILNCPAEKEERKQYNLFTCVAWGEIAQALVNSCKKDDLIHIEGRLVTRRFNNNDGKTTFATNVTIRQFYKMGQSHTGVNNGQ